MKWIDGNFILLWMDAPPRLVHIIFICALSCKLLGISLININKQHSLEPKWKSSVHCQVCVCGPSITIQLD